MRYFGSIQRRVLGIGLGVVCVLWFASPSGAQNRHHIAVGLGYTKLVSDDLRDPGQGIDFTDARTGILGYRYTLNDEVDLGVDWNNNTSTETYQDERMTLTNSYFGPGVRWYPGGTLRTYFQGNVFVVREKIELEQGGVTVSSSESGAGFGMGGGVEFPLNERLSLPVGMHYVYAKPADDISGLGFTVALAFNFGTIR